jgi:hypothetical protein
MKSLNMNSLNCVLLVVVLVLVVVCCMNKSKEGFILTRRKCKTALDGKSSSACSRGDGACCRNLPYSQFRTNTRKYKTNLLCFNECWERGTVKCGDQKKKKDCKARKTKWGKRLCKWDGTCKLKEGRSRLSMDWKG